MEKSWWSEFWDEHGDRMFFLLLAVIFGVCFWYTDEMRGEAKTILVGCAMLVFNKARSTSRNNKPKGGDENVEEKP